MVKIKEYFKDKIKNDKVQIGVCIFYVICCVVSAIYFFAMPNVRNGVLAIFCGLIVIAVFLVEFLLKINLGATFTFSVFLLSFGGMQLGACYNFYFILPFWDDFLHGLSGLLFACLGYSLAKRFLKEGNPKWTYAVIGVMFSLSIAVLWEMIEYVGTSFFSVDMQEDMIITNFGSFFLNGTHNDLFVVSDIVKTIIYYGNGNELIIDGYLDIGLYDTLNDLVVCIIGVIVFSFIMCFDKLFKGKIEKLLIPTIKK